LVSGNVGSKVRLKRACLVALMLLSLGALTGRVWGQTQAQATIIPPSSCQAYTGQMYQLTIGVQYSFPGGSYYIGATPGTGAVYTIWVESPPYDTNQVSVSGSGSTELMMMLTAPSTPGTYTLPLTLYAQAANGQPMVMNTASVTCESVQPIVMDWNVAKVWLDPASPGEGDQVTFHATFALVSTNSPQPITVQVACLLDQSPYYTDSLTFQPQPQPSSQDVTVPQPWTATKGTHTLTCIVDPNNELNDQNPYPQGDFAEIRFVVQAYYAVIQSITTSPLEVNEGDKFSVIIHVSYHFPGSATLKVTHQNSGTQPSSEDQVDGVKLSGSGTKDYTFTVRAPFSTSNEEAGTCVQEYMLTGQGFVWFDRGEGAGWEKTDPGWTSSYNVTITRPQFYARFTQVTAEYAGSENATGHVTITLVAKYVLPVRTGLRVTIETLGTLTQNMLEAHRNMVVVQDESSFTQQDSAERTTTFTYTYSYPISSLRSGTLTFTAAVDYQACGAWNHGDEGTVSTPVPYTPYTQPTSASDYLMAAIQRIMDWFRSLMGGSAPTPTS